MYLFFISHAHQIKNKAVIQNYENVENMFGTKKAVSFITIHITETCCK